MTDANRTLTLLQRVVLPAPDALDTAPLYVDFSRASSNPTPGFPPPEDLAPEQGDTTYVHTEFFLDRRLLALPAGARVSFATYFNAFPASYWRRWTDVTEVTLRLRLEGQGMVVVLRSNARGVSQRVDSRAVAGAETVEFRLPLGRFADGGWYWFDLISGREALTLVEADWLATASDTAPGTATLEITTMNKPDYCVGNLAALAASDALLQRLDEVLVVDQGTRKVRDDPGFPAVAEALAGKLRIIEQANLGGSGGFARGMYEAVQNGSTWVLLMDDDIQLEPESMQRLMTFSDRCRRPTLVGAQMFDLFDRTVLHAFGEVIDRRRWQYAPAPGAPEGPHDFAMRSLRNSRALHTRVDVDYNGWWMELIPTSVIREIGLSLPLFIKWDDAEYGIRAQVAGYATVTLPGAAVWHESWAEKDDLIGWQAYFHGRNRLVTALLHSPFERGGTLAKESNNINVKHLIAMEYYTEAIKSMAMEDVLAGPDGLFDALDRRILDVRAMAQGYSDAELRPDADAFPTPQPRDLPALDGMPDRPSRKALLSLAAKTVARQVVGREQVADAEAPQAHLPNTRREWWRVSQYSSVLVSSKDGSGVAWYRRRPELVRSELRRTAVLAASLYRQWPELRKRYRAALPALVSLDAWAPVFARHTSSEYRV